MASESSTRVSHSLSETRSIQENEKNVVVDIQNSKSLQGNTHDPQLTDDDIWNLDTANPRNWTFRKKWTAAGIVSLYTFVSPLASSMMAPGLLQVAEQYHVTNPTTLAMTLSIFLLALYMAFMYGIYYLMFATFANFFKEAYNFSPGIGGLCYLGLGIGFFIATMFGAKIGDQIYASLSEKNGGVGKPEMRVPALIFGSFFVPIGLLYAPLFALSASYLRIDGAHALSSWYGWSAQARLHWIMPIIGSGIFGFGLMTTFLPIQLYLVDAFSYAASALAAASVLRSLLGFVFPLFGQQMYNALGLGGGNSLLAGLSIVLGIPFPIWIWYNGERIRLRSTLSKAN
ncbi:hypothetical protein EYR36_006196 [Pleurotus pulmonarius]|nr:hypothetical protein EYR36_006196 [Pleurotus pulmonarius]